MMLLTALPAAMISAAEPGDVDGDGKISSSDARLALRASVGLEDFSAEVKAIADVDGDEKVTSSDARLILRASVGLETLHKHSYTGAVTTPATCTQKGVKTFTCSCGDSYTEELPATGHTPVTDKAVAPTCTVNGKTAGSHCGICGTVLQAQTAISATGHKKSTLDSATVKAESCGEDGYTGDYKCDVCGTVTTKGTVIPKNEEKHVIVNTTIPASCTEDGYKVDKCKFCEFFDSQSIVSTGEVAKGHDYGTPVVINPTCTEEGYKIKTCKNCGDEVKYDYVSENGHAYSWTTAKKASCKETGTENGTCSTCGDKTTRTIPLQPCTDIKTTTVKGNETTLCKVVAKCNTCGTVVNERAAEDYEHKMMPAKGQIPSSPTCTEPGLVDMKCDYCYKAVDDYRYAEPLGHEAEVDTENTKQATCTEPGTLAYKGNCTRCNQPVENANITIPKKGHQLSGVQTCTTAVVCTRKECGQTIHPKLGHDYVIPSAVSVYEADTPAFFCNRCGSAAENKVDTFNNVTALIKAYPFANAQNNTVSFFDKTVVKTEYSRFDFGIYTNAIKDMYESEMANTPDDFSPVRKNYGIRPYLPITYNAVSELTAADVDSITVERLTSLNVGEVLSAYPNSYTVGNKTYELTPYKTKVITDDVIKVTIDVKNESYQGVKTLPMNSKTSLQKLFDIDIREEANEFKNENGDLIMTETDKGDGYEISMEMRLQNITSDGQVVYYFKADNYEPILAVYKTSNTMTQTIGMKFKIGLFSLNGELDPIITTNVERFFFFSGTFG